MFHLKIEIILQDLETIAYCFGIIQRSVTSAKKDGKMYTADKRIGGIGLLINIIAEKHRG